MGMMNVAFAAASRDLAMFALAAVGWRLLDFQVSFRILVRSAWTTLPYAVRRFGRCRHHAVPYRSC
jgi:hypothetical protein